MGINVYCGLMGSGKSYEVVSNVIVPAIAAGRRVVTNVDGINDELVRAYVVEKFGVALDRLGSVVHVTNEDVFGAKFFPYYDDKKDAVTDTVVQPGDLVAIDEAWRFWGTDCKLPKEHKSFFLEHRHFTHPESRVACDLVLMIQDMGTLHRFVKNVVAFSFRCHKKIALGMPNTYSVTMWEGHKHVSKAESGNWLRKYDPAIFPLYSSFKGGADGKVVNADARESSAQRHFVVLGLVVVVLVAAGAPLAWRFFHPPQKAEDKPAQEGGKSRDGAVPVNQAGTSGSQPARPVVSPFSESWRVAGRYMVNGQAWVVVADEVGRLRVVSPSMFANAGAAMVGEVDGQRVSAWSGPVARSSGQAAGRAAPVVGAGL